jgi:aerobic C4-dicarboxylate transport protein
VDHLALFVLIVLGAVAAMAGFSIIRVPQVHPRGDRPDAVAQLLRPALPSLMRKLENLGCSNALVGLVTPTGYIFNPDGSCIYMALAAVFVAQATGVPLTFGNYVTLFAGRGA